MSAFFGHNIARGRWGGRRDEPKAEQKIVLRSRVLGNYCWEGLFHTVPSSFVLHCGFFSPSNIYIFFFLSFFNVFLQEEHFHSLLVVLNMALMSDLISVLLRIQ